MSRNRVYTAIEVDFFDDYYSSGEHVPVAKNKLKKWLASLAPAMPNLYECNVKVLESLGDVRGKHICELGCGSGWLTQNLVNMGAYVSAIDISMEAVKITREKTKNLAQVIVQQMDVCDIHYGEESFDLVVGALVLHHVDVNKVAMEISRILKPNGKAIFVEPLGHNPLSNIWRRLTPNIRTQNEWPLSYLEIKKMGEHFSIVNYEEFDLLPLLSSLVYLFTFSHKAKIKSAELLSRLEPQLFRLCEPLKRYSGEVLIEFTK